MPILLERKEPCLLLSSKKRIDEEEKYKGQKRPKLVSIEEREDGE